MQNSQLSRQEKLKRLARKLGVKQTDDPDGTVAVLSIARRLVKDQGLYPTEALNEAANKYAAPRDKARAFWAAHYALMAQTHPWSLDEIEDMGKLMEIFDLAISSQGKINQAGKK